MAKVKAKTVKVRIAVSYDEKGNCDFEELWVEGEDPTERTMDNVRRYATYTHIVLVDVELPLPKPPKGKVTKVKVVEP